MKLSYTTMATPGLGVERSVGLAAKFGLNGIDLRVSDHFGELTENSTNAEIDRAKDILNSFGIAPAGLLCYNTSDMETESLLSDQLARLVEIADRIGSPSIRMFAPKAADGVELQGHLEKLAKIIRHGLEKGGKADILVQHHNGNLNAVQASRLARLVDEKRFGIILSPDHCMIQKEDIDEVGRVAIPYVRQVYIADWRETEDGLKVALPGEGSVRIREMLAMLPDDFDGWYSFKWEKIWNPDIEDAEKVLDKFVKYMKK